MSVAGANLNGKIEGPECRMFWAALSLGTILVEPDLNPLITEPDPAKSLTVQQKPLASGQDVTLDPAVTERLNIFFQRAYEKLTSMGEKQRQQYSVTPTRWKYFTHLKEELSRAHTQGRGLPMSFFRPFPQNDLSADQSVKALFKLYQLRGPNGIGGRIVSFNIVPSSQPDKTPLVIIHPDSHLIPELQKVVVRNLQHMKGEGPFFQASEATDSGVEETFPKTPPVTTYVPANVEFDTSKCDPKRPQRERQAYADSFYENSKDKKAQALPPMAYLECLLGDDIYTFGVDSRELKNELYGLMESARLLGPADFLAIYKNLQRNEETTLERSDYMVQRLVDEMKKADTKGKPKVVFFDPGSEHVPEIEQALKAAGINYLVIVHPEFRVEPLPSMSVDRLIQ